MSTPATFLAPDWCGRAWTPFVPFGASPVERRVFPTGGGLYRVRVTGRDQLAYVGQTGRDLRDRVTSLARGVLAAGMPWNDPHTAAPKLWSYRHAEGLAYEASVAAADLPKNDRMGLESYAVWQYRREAGASPLCNFGRLHRRYVTSTNRKQAVSGRRLGDAEPDNNGGPSLPPLAPRGTPDAPDWMGLAWSAPAPLTRLGLNGAPTSPGVYRIADEGSRVMYIGQSTGLADRLRSHARSTWPVPALYSLVTLAAGITPTQLLEVENDLIAGHFGYTGHAPPLQFGEGDEPPAEPSRSIDPPEPHPQVDGS